MIALDAVRAYLGRVAGDADADQLPELIGVLAAAQATALARVVAPAPPALATDDVVDVATLSAELGLAPSWLRAQARANKLPHLRCGKYIKFRRADVLATLARSGVEHGMAQTVTAEKSSNGGAVSAGFHIAQGRRLMAGTAPRRGTPGTHHARQGALTRPTGRLSAAERHRIDKRTRRQLDRLERALVASPVESVRDNLIGSIARKTLLAQRCEAALLGAPDLSAAINGPAKFAVWLWNSLRRDGELLVLLEREISARRAVPALETYIASRQVAPPAAQITQAAEGDAEDSAG